MSEKPLDDETGSDENDGPQIEASAEIEEALREATEAVEARQQEAKASKTGESQLQQAVAHGDGPSADKLTIELLSSELQDLKNIHEEKLKETEAQNEKYLRYHAEFENFRNRTLKEKQESLKFGYQNLVKDLLSVVDNLERALEHGAQDMSDEVKGILAGVELVHREILGAFAKHGVREIEAEGQVFDPAVHEAMGQLVDGDVPVNSVLQVVQKGYLIHDRMLRPARVIVAREAEGSEAGADDEPIVDESA